MRLAPEGNIIIYPLFLILVISFGIDLVFSQEYLFYVNIFLLVLFVFCLNFFRDPKRIVPVDENCIVSPADGKIIKIKEFEDPHTKEKLRLVSFFLSVFKALIVISLILPIAMVKLVRGNTLRLYPKRSKSDLLFLHRYYFYLDKHFLWV